MPKYLIEGDYSAAGTAGLRQGGGTKREKVVKKMVEALGGKVECFYYTFGIRDVICIAELPDNVSAAAISLAVSASGSVAYKTTVLLTPAEIDKASKTKVTYTPPGA